MVAIITIVISSVIGAPAGYALARFNFRGRDVFRLVIVSTRAFPIVILSIPIAVAYIQLGINDNVFSLALMHCALALPFTVLVTSSVFAGVPRDLEEAAETLGCSDCTPCAPDCAVAAEWPWPPTGRWSYCQVALSYWARKPSRPHGPSL